ncbi:hypothetical protein [Cellulomonas sp. HZM]|uniref:hypothetical protein n=1 Tax=Cellulomonas sp. HZM TaxID=1454010 RepID=UPI000492F884|nr:hypothetical protein [Cellulomonas sp. HZM]
MLTRRAVPRRVLAVVGAVALAGGIALTSATAAVADEGNCGRIGDCGSQGSSHPDGSIVVKVWGTTVQQGGQSVTVPPSSTWVHPVCWYEQSMSGKEYAEWVDSGKAEFDWHHTAAGDGPYKPYPGYEDHKDDDEGHWYGGTCSSAYWKDNTDTSGFFKVADAWFAAHPSVWVDADDNPPDVAVIDPVVLRDVAQDSMKLSAGDIHWNPRRDGDAATFVGMKTWVWLTGTLESAQVTAEAAGTWARVDAKFSGLALSAPGAPSSTCPDPGTPWTAGASGTDCALTFARSSASLPVKQGHSEPTATLHARATWTSSWVSSQNAQPTALPDVVSDAYAEVPVAEIESLATSAP